MVKYTVWRCGAWLFVSIIFHAFLKLLCRLYIDLLCMPLIWLISFDNCLARTLQRRHLVSSSPLRSPYYLLVFIHGNGHIMLGGDYLYQVDIWQMSLQLRCSDDWQIWIRGVTHTFVKLEISLTNYSTVLWQPHPSSSLKFRLRLRQGWININV